ncbi:serine hydrolase [Mycolicibacterium hassiacum]|uniref:serine hydrolase n=1 Tax=Mycolicibacterium hassiacum TaxID=46351 RepID=UPI0018725E09|nr:serine hydrolase [Mycolicibacterium hassiacum]
MPAPRPDRPAVSRFRGRRASRIGLTLAATVLLLGGCATPAEPSAVDAPYGAPIPINTPQGLRARQTMDMLNSDWPIGHVGVATLAAPDKVEEITGELERIWWDRPFTVQSIEIGAGRATLDVETSYGVEQRITLATDDEGRVDDLEVELRPPAIRQWSDIDAELSASGARYSYQFARIRDTGQCERVAGTNTDLSLPLASIFKLYVLLAVADAVKAGTMSWDDSLTITEEGRKLGSPNLDRLPAGAQISVRTAAQQMISASDNMTTDLLMTRLGPGAMERALRLAGHHDPASMTPFPTIRQLFSVGWGQPDVRAQWKKASHAERVRMLEDADSRPFEPDPLRHRTPASDYGVEWYGNAEDICRLHVALQNSAVGAAAPVKEILSVVPGITLDRTKFPYIGAKGGNLPGDLTFSWYVIDRTGQPWVVSFQLNWPKYRSLTAAGWLLSIAGQGFELLPVGQGR